MKKVIVVSKTHLDLGFTDYAENIRQKYIHTFIPSAVALANQVNTATDKKFIWTTGSWILKEALRDGTEEEKEALKKALKNGNIVPHALPFTLHTELLDEETLAYGMTVVDELDALRGKKTIAAKMTDVPGHTAGLVPLLANHGIKLLHIGVNGASAVPEVPECFLWKVGDTEIVVIYSGGYGGVFRNEFVEEALYLDHTLDNHGAPSPEALEKRLVEIQKEYPDYEVTAGTLDDIAEVLWAVKDKLPVYTGEIGDTWIHGSATDPYKSAALRTLMGLKRQWLADGTMQRDTAEYKVCSDALLCVAEHTCGMDSKISLGDYEHYLKPDFQKARKHDDVTAKHIFRNFPHGIIAAFNRRFHPSQNRCAYSVIEKSWAEQRAYITKAVNALFSAHRAEATKALAALRPTALVPETGTTPYQQPITFGGYALSLNADGGIATLSHNGTTILKGNDAPLLEYRSYCNADYEIWFANYARDLKKTAGWARPDFGRPMLKYAEGKYPTGRFFYKMTNCSVEKSENDIKIFADFACDRTLCEKLGAPREVQVIYTLSERGLHLRVLWLHKDASRLTEALFLHLFPDATGENFRLQKLGTEIDYRTTASMGGRNLHAVEKSILQTANGKYDFVNLHAPLISIGRGKILEYDNKIENIDKDGISYVLCNNVWGTNFPLWYEDNAQFDFVIAPTCQASEHKE